MSKIATCLKLDSFTKCLKKDFDNKSTKRIYQAIERFEAAENEFLNGTDALRQKLNSFGKTLSKIGQKDIYCLEIGTDRALARIVEQDNVKVFVWFWAGSHEKYNNVLKQMAHQKPDPHVDATQLQHVAQAALLQQQTSEGAAHPELSTRLAARREHFGNASSSAPSDRAHFKHKH